MVTINEFLDNVLKDFKAYVDSQDQLCDLLDAHFDAGKVPDYSDVHIQQLYLLRYAYGYAFEYKQMYKDLMARIKLGDKIKVTSVGCGNLIDYWALARVINGRCKIKYWGIDTVDWKYKMPVQNADDVKFINTGAVEYFKAKEKLSSDVYIFPKSISEFEQDEMVAIANCLPKLSKDRVHFLFSLRTDSGSIRRDAANSNIIYQKMQNLSFHTEDNNTNYYIMNSNIQGKTIRAVDHDFQHPKDVVDYLKELYSHCSDFSSCHSNIECAERLGRFPILKCQQAAWQIFTFER